MYICIFSHSDMIDRGDILVRSADPAVPNHERGDCFHQCTCHKIYTLPDLIFILRRRDLTRLPTRTFGAWYITFYMLFPQHTAETASFQMLEFCNTVDPNLDNYEADGAWPTLLDDFVSWKKEHSGGGDQDAGEKKDDDE